MVTLVSELVRDAFQMAGVIGPGEYPRPNEEADAIRSLQNIVLSLPGFVTWEEVETSADYTAEENQRVRVITADPVTITIPTAVSSAQKVLWCCNQIELYCQGYDDRAPRDGARVAVADAFSDNNVTYYYRADIAQWTPATALTRTSEMPFSADLDRHITAILAGELNPNINPTTAALITEGRLRAQRRFDQPIARTVEYF